MLRSGEFIMNEPATKMFAPMLAAMNAAGNKSIGIPSRAAGGSATPQGIPAMSGPVTLSDASIQRLAAAILAGARHVSIKAVDANNLAVANGVNLG